jgi:hypothetical protein
MQVVRRIADLDARVIEVDLVCDSIAVPSAATRGDNDQDLIAGPLREREPRFRASVIDYACS